MMTAAEWAEFYTGQMGWALVAIPAGSKAPNGFGWQQPERALVHPGPAREHYERKPTHNMGLLHSASGTVALDIDHMEHTRLICQGLGIDLDAILASGPRIVGRKDRGKVLFAAPHDGLKTHKISWPIEGDPRRTSVVFELRAGAVQDVLPPSIHPDTGNPYTWAGPSVKDGLPPLPAPLLTIWENWDRFRPQLMALCPWGAPPPAPPRRPRPPGDRASVIDAYNAANEITETLQRYGYKPTARNRFLSPNSSSGLAGVVVFEDGRAYSHHASDPFDSAHTFDAFDLFAAYEHGGDVTKAVKDAADFLNITRDPEHTYDPEAIAHGAKVAATILAPRPADDVPEHLLEVPGILNDAVTYYRATAPKAQDQFAVQTALAFGAAILGRRWRTDQNNYSSLYFVNVAKSATGKEHAKTVLEALLEASGQDRLIGPSGYTSASGVFSALVAQPSHVAIIDELGRVLASSAAQGNYHKADAQTILMEVFGRQSSTLRPQGYSKMGMTAKQAEEFDKVVRRPALTLMAMTTPSTLYDNLSSRYVSDGFLGRFLIVESHAARSVGRITKGTAISERLIEWAKGLSANGDLGPGSHDIPPAEGVIPFSPACHDLLRACDAAMLARMDEYERWGMEAMFGRTKEIAQRLALIVAMSRGEAEISPSSLQWAIDYATFYADRTVKALRRHMADGPFEAACKAVYAQIEKAGLRGATLAELSEGVKAFANLEPRKRREVLEALADDKGIVCRNTTEGRGRPRMAWLSP